MNELEKMSETKLKEVIEKGNKILAEMEEERRKKKERKQSYSLKTPEDTYTFNVYRFYREAMSLGKTDPELKKKLEEVEKKCYEKEPERPNDVYPCPECGEMTLRAGNFGDGWLSKYQIMCDDCDFVAPTEPMSAEWSAWDEFHIWLIKNGYL